MLYIGQNFLKVERAGRNQRGIIKWNDNYSHFVFQLALLGATDQHVADAFNVSHATIQRWKQDHPEFALQLKRGKFEADARVAESFYNNCHDREYFEEEAKVIDGEVRIVKVKKMWRGDKIAQQKWLSCRNRGIWTESQASVPTQNSLTINILKELSDEELKLMEKISRKQLPEYDGDNQ